MKFIATLACLFVAQACDGAEAVLSFQIAGHQIPVGAEAEKRIIHRIEKLVRSANFNSLDHPDLFKQASARTIDELSKDSFIHIHYNEPVPFQIGGPRVAPALDIWVDLPGENPSGGGLYPGPIWLTNGDAVVRLAKCDGICLLGLGLDPAVYPNLPERMKKTMDAGKPTYDRFKNAIGE